jgi:hypothetical protein
MAERLIFHAYTLALCAALVVCVGLVFNTQIAHAQFINTSALPTLELEPATPAPESRVRVTLNAYAIDTASASIAWYKDGSLIPDTHNAKNISVAVGKLGTRTTIEARITPQSGSPTTVTRVINSADVDLIIESDSYVPSFYRGRALPSAGVVSRVVALPRLSINTDPATLTYAWNFGGSVLLGGPTKGARSVVFRTPPSDTLLSLTITDARGAVLVEKSVNIEPADVDIEFYEENPLRGLSHTAIIGTLPIVDEELTVRAVPYFANPQSFTTTGAVRWYVDRRSVPNTDSNPLLITLRKSGGSGNADVSFSYRDTISLMHNLEKTFSVYFEDVVNTFSL